MRLLKLLLVLVCATGSAAAGPLDEAVAAYDKGDYATALRIIRPLAELGVPPAQYNLGNMYRLSQGVPRDYAIGGFMVSQGRRARLCQRPDQPRGYVRSWRRVYPKTTQPQCRGMARQPSKAMPTAQYNLGLMYNHGQGVPQDYAAAMSWYRKAAEQGLAPAQYNLGYMYDHGQGVPLDYALAVSWYRKAAEQGDGSAQNNLGVMYQIGQGVFRTMCKRTSGSTSRERSLGSVRNSSRTATGSPRK